MHTSQSLRTLLACLVAVFALSLAGKVSAADSSNYVMRPGMSREAFDLAQSRLEENQASAQATIDADSVSAQAEPALTLNEKIIEANNTYVNHSQQAVDSAGRIFAIWTDSRNGGVAVRFSSSVDQGQTWSADVRLDRNSAVAGTVTFADIVSDDFCNVYVAFGDTRNVASGQPYFTHSADCGETWTSPLRISSTASMQDSTFDLIARPNGGVFIAWDDNRNDVVGPPLQTEIYGAASADFGATWGSEVKISDPAPASSDDYGPVATWASDGSILVGWSSDRTDPSKSDFYYARSLDFGSSWSSDARLNTNAIGTASLYNWSLCADGNRVFATYSIGVGDAQIKSRVSTDHGATFNSPVSVGPSLATDKSVMTVDCAGDRAVVGFGGGPLGGPYDGIYVATTADGGSTWTSATKADVNDPLGSGNFAQGLSSFMDPAGHAVIVWADTRSSNYEGYYNYSTDGSSWQTTDYELTNGPTGSHNVFLSQDAPFGFQPTLINDGTEGDNQLNVFQTYYDDRVTGNGAGMYSAHLTFPSSMQSLVRLSGATRVETAVDISQDSFPADGSATAVVIATKSNFPDGLAGGPLSVLAGGPLLITSGTSLDQAAADELVRVFDGQDDTLPDVYILGGEAAISSTVEAQIAALDPLLDIERLAGATRVGTAVAVAEKMDTLRGHGPSHAMIANSQNFPDALSASAPASSSAANADLMPILLTNGSALDTQVSDYLTANAGTLTTANLVGGTAVLSDAVSAAVHAIVAGGSRYGGANRYETAILVNSAYFTGLAQPTTFGIASGENFPDALTGGAHSGRNNQPLLLVTQNGVPDATMGYVASNSAILDGGNIYGGTAAISDAVKVMLEGLY